MNAEQTFRAKAPGIMDLLRSDFGLSVEDAAAILGNLGHECAGFTKLQESKPVVPGSKGGFGWAQWTGPRRRAYEAYCSRNGLDPASDKANYAYLFIELKGIEGSEKSAIPKLKAALGLDAKVEAFELAFLRAGVKHYESRKQWAKIAMDAWTAHVMAQKQNAAPEPPQPPPEAIRPIPIPKPVPVAPAPAKSAPNGWLVAAIIAAAILLIIGIWWLQ